MGNIDAAFGRYLDALAKSRACDAVGYCVCEAEALAAYDALVKARGSAWAQGVKELAMAQPVNRDIYAHGA